MVAKQVPSQNQVESSDEEEQQLTPKGKERTKTRDLVAANAAHVLVRMESHVRSTQSRLKKAEVEVGELMSQLCALRKVLDA